MSLPNKTLPNCNKCHQPLIKIAYRIHSNDTRHLVGLCENCGWRHIPKIEGLEIDVVDSKLKSKLTRMGRVDKTKTKNAEPVQQMVLV